MPNTSGEREPYPVPGVPALLRLDVFPLPEDRALRREVGRVAERRRRVASATFALDEARERAAHRADEALGARGGDLRDRTQRVVLVTRQGVEPGGVIAEDHVVQEHHVAEGGTDRIEQRAGGFGFRRDHQRLVGGQDLGQGGRDRRGDTPA